MVCVCVCVHANVAHWWVCMVRLWGKNELSTDCLPHMGHPQFKNAECFVFATKTSKSPVALNEFQNISIWIWITVCLWLRGWMLFWSMEITWPENGFVWILISSKPNVAFDHSCHTHTAFIFLFHCHFCLDLSNSKLCSSFLSFVCLKNLMFVCAQWYCSALPELI